MQIHARFRLDQVNRSRSQYKPQGETEYEQVEGAYVYLYPVQGEPFGPATPSGKIEMLIVNPTAAEVFFNAHIGQEFDVLLTLRGE